MRDAERILPRQEIQLVKDSRIPSVRIAEEFGGPNISFAELAQIFVELGCGDPNVAQALQPHFYLIECMRLSATLEQQKKFSKMVLGGALTANAFAERGGKVVGETLTKLKRDGAGYKMSGKKFYSTGSLYAEFLYATAVREDGILCLVIFPRDRAGVNVIDDWDGMGQRTTASGTTELNDVAVNEDEVVPVPSFRTERVYIGAAGQIVHAAIDAGIAKAAFLDAISYAPKARAVPESGVEKSTDDVLIMSAVGEMAVLVHSAEAMLRRAGEFVDEAARVQLGRLKNGDELDQTLSRASVAVAEAKVVANNVSLQVAEMMFRVGGAGMTARKYNFDRHWRNARTHTTHDPVAYKYKAVGDYFLNKRLVPISTKI